MVVASVGLSACAPSTDDVDRDDANLTVHADATLEQPVMPPPSPSTSAPSLEPPRTAPTSTIPASTIPASTTPASTQAVSADLGVTLQNGLAELLDASGALGGIAAVRHGSAEPVIVTAGVVDDTGVQMTTDRPFPIASLTKSFTAALIVDLAAGGNVDLDAPIAGWVDWPDGDRITLRQLLTHTSGIGAWAPGSLGGEFDDALFADLASNHSLAEAIDLARGVAPVGPPGGQTYYSNLNYVLAGRIAELAAGMPFAQLLAERITVPLGLADTTYPAGLEPTVGAEPLPGTFEFPEGVIVRTTDFPQSAFLSLMGPSAAGIATVDDLFTWGDALFRSRRLGDVDLAPLLDIAPGGSGLGVLGIDRESGTCVFSACPAGVDFEYLGLNGEAPGSAVRFWYDPITDTTLLIYLNRDGTSLDAALVELMANVS